MITKLSTSLLIFWIIAISILYPEAVSSDQKTFFSERVSFTPPIRWQEMTNQISDTLVKYMYFIPFTPAEGTEHSINAMYLAKKVPIESDTTLSNHIVYSRQYPNYLISDECNDNEHWKSYIWQAMDGDMKYVGLERIGVSNGILIQAMLSFPLMNSLDSLEEKLKVLTLGTSLTEENTMKVGVLVDSYFQSIIDEFNLLCVNCDIDSTKAFQAQFLLNEIPSKGARFLQYNSDSNKSK